MTHPSAADRLQGEPAGLPLAAHEGQRRVLETNGDEAPRRAERTGIKVMCATRPLNTPSEPSASADCIPPDHPIAAGSSPAAGPRPAPEAPIFCPQCGYSLYGIPEQRCPECGFGYDRRALRSLFRDRQWNLQDVLRSQLHWSLLAVAFGSAPWLDDRPVWSAGLAILVAAGTAVWIARTPRPIELSPWVFLGVLGLPAMFMAALLLAFDPLLAKVLVTPVIAMAWWRFAGRPSTYPFVDRSMSAELGRYLRRRRYLADAALVAASVLVLRLWLK